MSVIQTILFYGLFVLALLFFADAILTFIFSVATGKEKRINKRLHLQSEGKKIEEIQEILKTENRDGFTYKKHFPFYKMLHRLIYETNSQITVERLYLLVGVCCLAWLMVFQIMLPFAPFWLKLILSLPLGAAPIILFLVSARSKKIKKFEEQLPDALDLIVRSLRIGHPLSSSIEVVAKEMPDPLGTEFGLAFDEISFGKEVPEAVQELADRVPVADLKYFAVAVQIHYESGGNLAEILNGLSNVIRDRFRMFRKVKALTTEGRLSAWFLSVFPFALILLIQMVKPDYYSQVYDYPYFPHMVVATIVLLFINIIMMRMITSIKV